MNQHNDVGHVGDFLKEFRYRNRVSQAKLAETLKVDPAYIGRCETGEIRKANELIKRLYLICNADERVELVQAIRQDAMDELTVFLESLDGE